MGGGGGGGTGGRGVGRGGRRHCFKQEQFPLHISKKHQKSMQTTQNNKMYVFLMFFLCFFYVLMVFIKTNLSMLIPHYNARRGGQVWERLEEQHHKTNTHLNALWITSMEIWIGPRIANLGLSRTFTSFQIPISPSVDKQAMKKQMNCMVFCSCMTQHCEQLQT